VKGARPLPPALPHPKPVTAVTFGQDEDQFLTACEDGYVRVWRKARGHQVTVLWHRLPPPVLAASTVGLLGSPLRPSPLLAAAALIPGNIDSLRQGGDEEHVVNAVAFDHSGQRMATAGLNGKVKLWKVPGGVTDGEPLSHRKEVKVVAFTRDRPTVVTGCMDHLVRFWDLTTRQVVVDRTLEDEEGVIWLSIDPKGDRIVTLCEDRKARLWDAKKRKMICELQLPDAEKINVVAVSPNKQWSLAGGVSGTARLWDKEGQPRRELRRHQGTIWEVKFSRNDARVVTASDDRNVCIWDTATGELKKTLTHRSYVSAAEFDLDGRRVLTASKVEGAQVWDIQLQRRVGPSCRRESEVVEVSHRPTDGKIAALAYEGGYGLLWTLPEPIEGDPERITSWVQTVVGMRLDEGGGHQVLEGSCWVELQAQLRQKGGPP
jgi:WD40 repeat protein